MSISRFNNSNNHRRSKADSTNGGVGTDQICQCYQFHVGQCTDLTRSLRGTGIEYPRDIDKLDTTIDLDESDDTDDSEEDEFDSESSP